MEQDIEKIKKKLAIDFNLANSDDPIAAINEKLPKRYSIKSIITHTARYDAADFLQLAPSGTVKRGEMFAYLEMDELGPLVMISSPVHDSFDVESEGVIVLVGPASPPEYYFVQDSPTKIRLMQRGKTIARIEA